MKFLPVLLSTFVAGSLCMSAAPVSATTITFEEFKPICDANPHPTPPVSPYSCRIENGYKDLGWDNFAAINAVANDQVFGGRGNGGVAGTVSGSICAFNIWGDPVTLTAATAPIALHSVYLTSTWRNGLTVKADGYLAGVQTYSKTVTLSVYSTSLISYEFANVDKVVWTASGGTGVGYSGDGTQFAMDDLSYDVVPEPSSVIALLCGMSGMAGLLIKRNR